MNNGLIVSVSPHYHKQGATTQRVMRDVLIALIPALIASVIIFGFRSLLLVAVSAANCVLLEFVWNKLFKKEQTIADLSAVVTGVLIAYNVPVTMPIWQLLIGDFIAVIIVKMLFGGIGCNFANPAVAARVFIMLAMPIALGAYPDIMGRPLDAITGATPLAMNAAGDAPYSYMDMMFGLHAGALGETCIITLLAGYVFLLVMRVVDAWATVPFIATVAVITGFAGQDAIYQVLSGGLALGAFYMATDYTTTPMTPKGKIIFGIGCGVITALVRLFAAAPEGVAFSILFMNMFTPLIDRYTRPQPAGGVKHALV